MRPDDEIDLRRSAHDLAPLGLRDATGNGNEYLTAVARADFLPPAKAAELRIDLFGRLLADVTGVEENEVGRLDFIDRRITRWRQRIHHPFGVVDVHLATVGLDVNALQLAIPCFLRKAQPLACFLGEVRLSGCFSAFHAR